MCIRELFERLDCNPLLSPRDVTPSQPGFDVACLLNPGVFRYNGRIGLLLRVAERPPQEEGWISTPVIGPDNGDVKVLRFRNDDPDVAMVDPRVFAYRGDAYLTTLSHLRLAWSDDGVHFRVESAPALTGRGAHEQFGIEDSRVELIDGRYMLTYTAVSPYGVAVGLSSTTDWRQFTSHGVIFPPHNKDCALFPRRIGDSWFALHRPSGAGVGGNYIWIARSPDLLHWGDHHCIATTRRDLWDSGRVGAGAAPIETPEGWLVLYHGADLHHRYCLGLILLDRDDPTRVIRRAIEPVMHPVADYELRGFFGNVVFTNGHIIDGDQITIYYGASDEVICAARGSVRALVEHALHG